MFLEQITHSTVMSNLSQDKPYIMIIMHIIAIYSWINIYMTFKEYVSHNSVILNITFTTKFMIIRSFVCLW